MNKLIILYTIVAGLFDCFIPIPVPTGIILSGFFITSKHIFLMTILCGFLLSLSSTLTLFLLRKLAKNKREKNSIWVSRLDILYQQIGYYAVFFGASFLLINWVTYTFLFVKNVSYKKYFLSMVLGRTLILFGYTYFTRYTIFPFIATIILLIYLIMVVVLKFLLKGGVKNKLISSDLAYSKVNNYDLSKNRFHKFMIK